jgi:mono/diheme cytochrome c family protein
MSFGKERRAVKRCRSLSRFLALVLFLGLAPLACSDSSTVPADAPEGHTVMKDGVAHAAGLSDPLQNCSSCHGANLGGGSQGQPSCTTCHGIKW